MTKSPKISVVTIVLNQEKSIKRTIESVLSQTYANIEYIIIDGGSTDRTIEIINEHAGKIDHFVSEPDHGISDAFNKGIALATGEIIGMLNADDWFKEDAVAAIVNASFKWPDFDIYYALTDLVDRNCILPSYHNAHLRLIENMSLAHPSVFVKRKAYVKYGLFDRQYKIAMDYEWLLRASILGALFLQVNVITTYMSPGGVSYIGFEEGQKEVAEIRKFYGISHQA